MLTSALPSKYLVKYGIWGAQEQGWPVRRTRFYAVALNLDTLIWLGPQLPSCVSAAFYVPARPAFY
eukprot:4569668-Lingulodinium_polyedra.AAC.1